MRGTYINRNQHKVRPHLHGELNPRPSAPCQWVSEQMHRSGLAKASLPADTLVKVKSAVGRLQVEDPSFGLSSWLFGSDLTFYH